MPSYVDRHEFGTHSRLKGFDEQVAAVEAAELLAAEVSTER
jgi:hypothetical protein